MIAKVTTQDLEKLMKSVRSSRSATYVTVSIDGPKLLFSFQDDAGKLLTVTLFDENLKVSPTVTRTESL